MMLQNLHTHTVFGDGKNTPEEMVRGAIASGCSSLGFSEHSPFLPSNQPDGWSMRPENAAEYRSQVLALREGYRGGLGIFLGLEQDIDSPAPDQPYDYLIGSVHSVQAAGGRCLSVDESPAALAHHTREYFGGDYLAFAEAYYQREAETAEKTGCQIIGHFDLVTKFNEGGCLFDENSYRYRTAALEALRSLLERDVIFEVNTGAISRGCRSIPYPAPFLLREICGRGGKICITSDSHSAGTVTYAFDLAAELALHCGFRETWILTERGFQAVDLESFCSEAKGAGR